MVSTNEKYWEAYDGLQFVKHEILREYLAAWFPIISRYNNKIIYLDCTAGRGRHETGQEGSPIIALNQLLNHSSRDRILSNTEVHFTFFEKDQENIEDLQQEINEIGDFPKNTHIHLHNSDYEEHMSDIITDLRQRNKDIAPTFAFIDPFGFSISMKLINELLSFPRTEILITFMLRYVDMAMKHEGQSQNLDKLFGTRIWKEINSIKLYEERIERIISLFADQLDAEYVSRLYMRSENNRIKYVLFHVTNHPKGRKKMKKVIWKVCPDGSFSASEKRHPNQLVLLIPKPDLIPLETHLFQDFSGKSVKVTELENWILGEIYLPTHLHITLWKLEEEGKIENSEGTNRIILNHNPTILFIANEIMDESNK